MTQTLTTSTVFICGRGRNSSPAVTLSTSGGVKVARSSSLAFIAAQARSLTSRGYPAFARRDDISVELVLSADSWQALTDAESRPSWVSTLIAVLNETQGDKT